MTDARDYLRTQQYATADNLVARQSIYRYQQPRQNLWRSALALAELRGDEAVLDVGCGNGGYLALLESDGHAGPVLGMDLSAGMLAAARPKAPSAALLVGDAQRLPVTAASFDVVLAMHMLYHVPDRLAAIAELRRVMRPDGRTLVVTNSRLHFRELDAFGDGFAAVGRAMARFSRESAPGELHASFGDVEEHDFDAELLVPEPEPVLAYARSLSTVMRRDDAPATLEHMRDVVEREIAQSGAFRITTAVSCFVCTA